MLYIFSLFITFIQNLDKSRYQIIIQCTDNSKSMIIGRIYSTGSILMNSETHRIHRNSSETLYIYGYLHFQIEVFIPIIHSHSTGSNPVFQCPLRSTLSCQTSLFYNYGRFLLQCEPPFGCRWLMMLCAHQIATELDIHIYTYNV